MCPGALRIDVGALVAPSAVDVDLTLNGQQFSAEGLRFAVSPEPVSAHRHHAAADGTEHWHSPLETA